jgi:tetraacyldisaccharide 4'-kinase
VEYLADLLADKYKTAILSRGYKRKTKQFRFVEPFSLPGEVGDEPLQIKRKFPQTTVAVDIDRLSGIRKLLDAAPETGVFLLDDAFQYRRVKPSVSVLLCDYHRPMYRDSVLPGGRLREWPTSAKRADVMIVTKTPQETDEKEQNEIRKRYARIFHGKIFFSGISYGDPLPVFATEGKSLSMNDLKSRHILLITGIARPEPFVQYIAGYSTVSHHLAFPDHHFFTDEDMRKIRKTWDNMPSPDKLLITTEKDAVRLGIFNLPASITGHSYYIPVTVRFAGNEKQQFDNFILNRVQEESKVVFLYRILS